MPFIGPDSIHKDLLEELALQREDRLLLGTTFLDQFVQLNWTGPRDAVPHYISNEEQVVFYVPAYNVNPPRYCLINGA